MAKLDLMASYRKIAVLQTIYAHLAWDLEVNLPEGSHDLRNEQILWMQSEIHRLSTEPDFVEAVSAATAAQDLPEHQLKNLRQFVLPKTAVPSDLQRLLNETELRAVELWKTAKEQNNFSLVIEPLTKLIELRKKIAENKLNHPVLGKDLKGFSHYDVMLSQSEPGLTNKDLERLFIPLKKGLIERVHSIKNKNHSHSSAAEFNIPIEKLLTSFGFNFQEGRLDYIKAYPFCSGGQGDVRITTRREGDAIDNLLTTLHEMGHGLYEQNLPKDLRLTPSGNAVSTGFHESQSRFYENQIGRSDAFIKYLAKHSSLEISAFKAQLRSITPSPTRPSADEVHYNLHIILRWEIETALVAGTMAVADIPAVWNQKMKEYFGITIQNDSEGCLQDLHWFMSDFAWFPTYTLGNLIAAQLYGKMKTQHPDWQARIENGDFLFIKDFLNQLHSLGSKYSFTETIQKLFGQELSEKPLLAYLDERYF